MGQKLEKRIPVTEDTWKKLGSLKEAGQTYESLLKEMIQEHNRKKLMDKMEKVEQMDEEELVALDDV